MRRSAQCCKGRLEAAVGARRKTALERRWSGAPVSGLHLAAGRAAGRTDGHWPLASGPQAAGRPKPWALNGGALCDGRGPRKMRRPFLRQRTEPNSFFS